MGGVTEALRASVDRLRSLVKDMGDADFAAQAYPTEWTVADTLSHLGSGAVINRRRLEAGLEGQPVPDGFNQSVWDAWNAKPPAAQVQDALAEDERLVEAIGALGPEDRERFHTQMGPMTLDFSAFVTARLSEHALHTWDIAVVRDPKAQVGEEAVPHLLGRIAFMASFHAKPLGSDGVIHVRTTDPERNFTVILMPDKVDFSAGGEGTPDIEMPAEALIRLIYGRLDLDHTPSVTDASHALDDLRLAFPGS
ncbi:MAG: maleylpyruvate isomerase family mycothiol-dependent enzyme [Acidimicrobiales bacterium]